MSTLIISDLHIGQAGGTSVLGRPQPIEILVDALAGYDRLVLLGDIVEQAESSWPHSAQLGEPILRRLAASVGEIVLLPGNHDHALIRSWVQARGANLEREDTVPLHASPELSQLAGWLRSGGADVEIRYPGIWLSDTVWASHGHYLNHFLKPVSSYGAHSKKLRSQAPAALRPFDFEHVVYAENRPHMSEGVPPQRWHDRLIPARLAPIWSWGLDIQVRRHALPAFGNVVTALGVDGIRPLTADGGSGRRAEYAVFGHIHRAGPMPLDNPREWTAPNSDVKLLNTGSWRYEPVIAGGGDSRHPYWPGGAVAIADDGIPRAINLLQDLKEIDLR